MPEELVPPVVAVVVTSNPGAWFESCLGSIEAQDYPNLALLVVDNGSRDDVTSRVAAVEPSAVVRRLDEPGGYSVAANEALVGIEGVTFFLFCHDDVELGPGALRELVSESFRLNAAIVGPKVVEADQPDRLAHVGLGMHRLGRPVDRVEAGELDQSQHDEAREVFAVPSACMLVRADLFEALGGFDRAISFFGEDVDLCWRAQVAGARVVVAPSATVGHREATATGERVVGEMSDLRHRHQIRTVLKGYGRMRRVLAVIELLVRSVFASAGRLLSGSHERGGREAAAWRWNLANRSSLRDARRELREVRQVPDHVLVRRMEHRSRFGAMLHHDGRTGQRPVLHLPHRAAQPASLGAIAAGAVLVLVALLGLRDVLFAPSPLVGQLVRMHSGSTLIAQYFGGRPTGGSGVQPSPPGYLIVGLLGTLFGNSSALAWKVVELGALGVGLLGMARAVRPFGSPRARVVAAAALLFLPFGWNAVATGNVQAAVAIGGAPFLLSRLTRAAGVVGSSTAAAEVPRRSIIGQIAPTGLLVALLVALAPASALGILAIALGLALAALLSGDPRGAGRVLIVLAGASALAFVCLLPWSATFFSGGSLFSALTGAVSRAGTSPASLLRGHTGPIGAWWGTWGVFVAGSYALVVTRGERFRAALGWWFAALACVALAWIGSEGWLGAGSGATAIIAGPAAAAIAGLCGLAVAGFEADVTRTALGWRHGAAALAGLCAIGGALPVLGVAVGGHAGLPASGFDTTLSWPSRSNAPYRVLWMGDPKVLPGSGWQLEPGLSWYTSTTGYPQGEHLWPNSSPGSLVPVAGAVRAAELGRTADVGQALAREGVRFLVVPGSNAPRLPGSQAPSLTAPPSTRLVQALRNQGDLVEEPVEAGALVFRNADWSAAESRAVLRAPASPSRSSSPAWRALGTVVALGMVALLVLEGVSRRRRGEPGPPEAEPVDDEAPVRDEGIIEELWEPEPARL